MTHDLSDFEQQLGRELQAAAHRRIEAGHTGLLARHRSRVPLAVAAAIAAVVIGWAVFASLRPGPAIAHPFEIVYLDNEIHLEIVDLVHDPRASERELADELGIEVEFVAVPVPAELIGQFVGVASSGTTAARVIFDATGRSERVVLPHDVDGELIIRYGREARPGERYHINITSPVCGEVWAMTPRQASARLAELAEHVRYDTFDSDYNYAADVAPAEVDPDYRLIDTILLSQNELLVVYSAHLDALGTERPNCGWVAASTR